MEKVYCVARNDLQNLFGGVMPEGGFAGPGLELVLALPQFFIPRSLAENDPDYKQVIPYQVFCCEEQFFVYQRGGGVGEQRLRGRYSLGVGGHINQEDCRENMLTPASYNDAMDRERHEELVCPPDLDSVFIGWINDESDAVGKVHLGAVHCCNINSKTGLSVRPDGEDIRAVGWFTRSEILKMQDRFEKWSILAASLF